MSHEVCVLRRSALCLCQPLPCVCPAQDMSSQQAVVESVASSLKKAGLFEMVLTSSVW